MAKIEIYALRDFKIMVDGVDIIAKLGASKKKISFLEYLIMNRNKAVSVSNLVDAIWPDDENVNPENAVKTMVSRLRKNLEDFGIRNAIVTRLGSYMWNPDLDCEIDVFEMERLCDEVTAATDLTPEVRSKFERIMFLYQDDLLANTNHDPWVMASSFYYHNLHLNTIYKYINLLNDKELYDDVVHVCKRALELDSFDSMLNLELMTALLKLGKTKDALAQYQSTTNMHYKQLGTKPSDEIVEFYKELIRNERNSEADIDEICRELTEDQDGSQGAFVCEYAIFKDIYHLQMRNLRRTDSPVFLVLVGVHCVSKHEAEPFVLDKVMRELLETLRTSLRRGDTVARYSPTQFAILLPTVGTYETGRLVMERVKRAFYNDGNTTGFVFNYRMGLVSNTPMTGR